MTEEFNFSRATSILLQFDLHMVCDTFITLWTKNFYRGLNGKYYIPNEIDVTYNKRIFFIRENKKLYNRKINKVKKKNKNNNKQRYPISYPAFQSIIAIIDALISFFHCI